MSGDVIYPGKFGVMRSERLLSIMLLLQTHGQLPASELAKRLEVSARTVMRDVEALSAAGVPVYTVRGPYGGIALLPGYRTNVTGLTTQEARALFVLLSGSTHADLGAGPGHRLRTAEAHGRPARPVPARRRPGQPPDPHRPRPLAWRTRTARRRRSGRAPAGCLHRPAAAPALPARPQQPGPLLHPRPLRPGQQGRRLVPGRRPPQRAETVPD